MINIDQGVIWIIINIIVLFLFFKKFLFKPVMDIIDKRSQLVNDTIQDADNKKIEADQLKSSVEEELKNVGVQASAIIKEAKERADIEYSKKMHEAKEEAARVMEEAEKLIELEKKKTMENAQAEIAGIAMLAAAKVIGKNVDNDTNKQFLGDFIKEVGASK